MTIGQIATQAVEAVRALNQLTADAGELAGPGEAREVIGRLALMGGQLPELCERLARFLVAARKDGQIRRGAGGDPDGVLVEVSEALSVAGRAADMMAAALAEVGAKAACRLGSGCGQRRRLAPEHVFCVAPRRDSYQADRHS